MAQYEPIGLKSGIATTLGTDTLRADLSGLAGLTTAAPAAGDACQLSGALTIAPAVNTSANPIVGIYDGVTGSVVRRGVVAASFVGGLTLVAGDAVYLSNVAGRLTNVKPTADNLHEVGVVVSAAASTIMLQIKPVVVLPATMLMYDARSSWLLQGDAPPAYPGEQQPFPNTAAALIAALGSPAGWVDANVLAIYQADTASPLVDSLGLGPNLVAAGGPLTGRECAGLPGTSFTSKVGAECLAGANVFASAAPAFMDPTGVVCSFLLVGRFRPYAADTSIIHKLSAGNRGWMLKNISGTAFQLIAVDGVAYPNSNVVSAAAADAAWHSLAGVLDGVNKTVQIFTDAGDGPLVGVWVGLPDFTTPFAVGASAGVSSGPFQVAYLACFDLALTSAMRAAFWRQCRQAAFNVPVTYTRAGPLVVPMTASRVCAYGTDQPAVGFNANFVAGTDNAAQVGTVHEDAISFEPIGSTDIMAAPWSGAGGNTGTAVDGPSGMRDAVRSTQAALAWSPAGGNSWVSGPDTFTVGASNVPFMLASCYKRATVGTTARSMMAFVGDAGGPEQLACVTDNATPVDWVRNTSFVTPTRPGHTQLYVALGADALNDNCDWAEPAVVKNRSTSVLAWRRVAGSTVPAATATPVTSITNVGNARFSPAKGRMTVRFAGMPAAATGLETLFCCGVAGAAGSMWMDRGGANLRLIIYDDVGVAVVNLSTIAIAVNVEHVVVVEWNAAAGTASVIEGGVVLGSATVAPWVPEPTDVTPILIGSGTGPLTAPRCFVALVNISNY